MEKAKDKWKRLASTTILFLMAMKPQLIYASSRFIERSGSAIYNGERSKEKTYAVINGVLTAASGVVSVIGALFAPLFVMVADSLYTWMGMVGMTLDSIVYGRVFNAAYMTDGIAMFTYDTMDGNIYGIVSMVIFSALSSVVFFFGVARVLTALVGFIYTSGGPQKREELKDQIARFVIAMLSIALAPALLDLAIYIRDICLYQVGVIGNSLVAELESTGITTSVDLSGSFSSAAASWFSADSPASLTSQFRAVSEGHLVNSMMYLATVGLTIYFAFVYVGAALSMVALVGFLPIAIVYNNYDRGILGPWLKAMLGVLLLPIIDAALLLVPIMIGGLSNRIVDGAHIVEGSSAPALLFIQFTACCCVMPARAYVRSLLGMRGSAAMEMAGLGTAGAGIGAMIGLGTKMKRIADQDREEQKGIEADEKSAEAYQAKAETVDHTSMVKEQAGAELVNQATDRPFMELLNEQELDGLTASQKAQARTDNLQGGIERMNQYAEGLQTSIDENMRAEEAMDDQMRGIDDNIAELQIQKAGYDPKDPADKESIRDIDQQIAAYRSEKEKLKEAKAGFTTKKNQALKEQKQVLEASRGAERILGDMNRFNTSYDVGKEASILDNLATLENFELPAYKNISAERRAQLYEERAGVRKEQREQQMRGRNVGTAVTAAASIGLGMMAGPAGAVATVQAASMAGDAGSMIAEPLMKQRSAEYAERDRQERRTYDGIQNKRYSAFPTDLDRGRYPSPESRMKEFTDQYVPQQITVPSAQGSSAMLFEENSDVIWNDMWKEVVQDPKNQADMTDCIRASMTDVYVSARREMSYQNMDALTNERMANYIENIDSLMRKNPQNRTATENIFVSHVNAMNLQKGSKVDPETYAKMLTGSQYGELREAVTREAKEQFLHDQTAAFCTGVFDRIQHKGYFKSYKEKFPYFDEKTFRNSLGKNGDYKQFEEFVSKQLDHKKLWPL